MEEQRQAKHRIGRTFKYTLQEGNKLLENTL